MAMRSLPLIATESLLKAFAITVTDSKSKAYVGLRIHRIVNIDGEFVVNAYDPQNDNKAYNFTVREGAKITLATIGYYNAQS